MTTDPNIPDKSDPDSPYHKQSGAHECARNGTT